MQDDQQGQVKNGDHAERHRCKDKEQTSQPGQSLFLSGSSFTSKTSSLDGDLVIGFKILLPENIALARHPIREFNAQAVVVRVSISRRRTFPRFAIKDNPALPPFERFGI